MHMHDMERELRRRGWRLVRITGGHRHYRNREGARITIAHHGTTGEVQPAKLAAILRDLRRIERDTAAALVGACTGKHRAE